jgi:hypothetical protein
MPLSRRHPLERLVHELVGRAFRVFRLDLVAHRLQQLLELDLASWLTASSSCSSSTSLAETLRDVCERMPNERIQRCRSFQTTYPANPSGSPSRAQRCHASNTTT